MLVKKLICSFVNLPITKKGAFNRSVFLPHSWILSNNFFTATLDCARRRKYPTKDVSTRRIQPLQEVVIDTKEEDKLISNSVIDKVNKQLLNRDEGRLFAIVHICGKQYRIVQEDVLILEGFWPPTASDTLRLEKVLLVAGPSFTLIGRPILPSNLVNITATVVEKDLSITKTHFSFIKRKRHRTINFIRKEHTTLRINKIEVSPKVNKLEDQGLERLLC